VSYERASGVQEGKRAKKTSEPGDSAYGEVGKSGLPFFLHRRIADVCSANGRNERPSNENWFLDSPETMELSDANEIQSPKNRVNVEFNVSGSPRSGHALDNCIRRLGIAFY